LSVTSFPFGPWKVTVRAFRSILTTVTTASVWPTTTAPLSCAETAQAIAASETAVAAARIRFMFGPCLEENGHASRAHRPQSAAQTDIAQLDLGPTRQNGGVPEQ